MKLKIWEMSLITALVVTMLLCCVAQNSQNELADRLVRLHVVANSDTDEDQALKLKVRDAVLAEVEEVIDGAENRNDAAAAITANMDRIADAACAAVAADGKTYAVRASLAREFFPTREYDTFSLPAGNYTSLRVTIGSGEGHNWWCVAFPPLCKSAAMLDKSAAAGLTDSQIALITGETDGYRISFKTLEILKLIREWLSA